MAAELKATQPHVKVTLAHSRDKLLSAEPLPRVVGDYLAAGAARAGQDAGQEGFG